MPPSCLDAVPPPGASERKTLARVQCWLRQVVAAQGHLAVLTGAGVSAESGVPTFRDALTGLWAHHDPQQLATEAGFRADPAMVWGWYGSRREAVRRVQPNAAHQALAAWAQAHPGRLTLITQNVDGLHQRAGSPEVLALHGDLMVDRWLEPSRCQGSSVCETSRAEPGDPPRCGRCGNWVRPGVVWFGEMLPADVLARAEEAAARCQLMLVVGTAGVVYPAAGLVHRAREAGARVVVINTDATELDTVAHAVLRGPAGTWLPALLGHTVPSTHQD